MFKDVTIYQINILFKICENFVKQINFCVFYNVNKNMGCWMIIQDVDMAAFFLLKQTHNKETSSISDPVSCSYNI